MCKQSADDENTMMIGWLMILSVVSLFIGAGLMISWGVACLPLAGICLFFAFLGVVVTHEKLIGEKRNPPMQDCDSRLRTIAVELRKSSCRPRFSAAQAAVLVSISDAIDTALLG